MRRVPDPVQLQESDEHSEEGEDERSRFSLKLRRRDVKAKAFFNLCIPSSGSGWTLEEYDDSQELSDGEVFAAFQRLYNNARAGTRLLGLFRLKEPTGVDFVRIRTDIKPNKGEKQRVALLRRKDIPPPREVEEKRYVYEPIPMDADMPMPSSEFHHYLTKTSPESHPNRLWARRLPEKLRSSLMFSDPLTGGWGIEIVESPNWLLIWFYNLLGLLFDGLVAFLYAHLSAKKDVQSAIAIGAWLFAVQAFAGGIIFLKYR